MKSKTGVFFLIFFAIFFSTSVRGAENTSPDPVPYFQQSAQYSTLIDKVRQKGKIRVIVRLNTGFEPEAKMEKAKVAGQRRAITKAQQSVLESLDGGQVKGIRQFKYIPFFALEVDETALKRLSFNPDVLGIAEDRVMKLLLTESVPLIGGDRASSMGYSGEGWTVAVLDSGVDANHPFLKDKVVAEACFSTSGANSDVESLCPQGRDSATGPGSANYCPYPIEGCFHGTHVAGIIAGKAQAINGVARDANILAVQVFSKSNRQDTCDQNPTPCIVSFSSDEISGLEYVYEHRNEYRIAAVNLSLGGDAYTDFCDDVDSSFQAYKTAIDNLRAAGIATVIASGNEGVTNGISTPACISSAVSVGSTGKSDVVSFFSNSASFLSLLAPGEKILSSVPPEWGTWDRFNGTSMATPHVAGAWAVLKQKDPSASVGKILAALQATGAQITDARNGITKSRIQVDAALPAISATPVYRFYNAATAGHFFTINEAEREKIVEDYPQFRFEGVAFDAFASDDSGALPVYRFYDAGTSGHFFTINEDEKTAVMTYSRFRYEGIGFYAYPSQKPGTMPVYRFFNVQTGDHFFTIDECERLRVKNQFPQLMYEGISYYAFPDSSAGTAQACAIAVMDKESLPTGPK